MEQQKETVRYLKSKIYNKNKDLNDSTVYLPNDITYEFPKIVDEWLDKYDLDEIEKSRFLWSEQYERLIYPVYDDYGNVVMYQGRKFASDGKKHSKYHTEGNPNKVYHFLGDYSQEEIVLVEDVVSAIKVSRVALAMPLWGSSIPLERIKTLSDRFSKLAIWLDKDKAEYSLKTRLNALPYFDEVRSIITEKDPKEYSTQEIKEILKYD